MRNGDYPARVRENLNTPNHITLAHEIEKSLQRSKLNIKLVVAIEKQDPATMVFAQNAIPIVERCLEWRVLIECKRQHSNQCRD